LCDIKCFLRANGTKVDFPRRTRRAWIVARVAYTIFSRKRNSPAYWSVIVRSCPTTSPAGRMTIGVINSVAQFERDLLIERTQSGLKRAKAGGEVFGRPPTLTEAQRAAVQEQIAAGASVSALAKRYGTSRQTVMRARDAALQ
jgi:DNA invertase Pin-like site-specific DNA recombinase